MTPNAVPMTPNAVPMHVNVRLSEHDRAAVASIARSLATAHRTPPTISEAIRVALRMAAPMASQGNPKAAQ